MILIGGHNWKHYANIAPLGQSLGLVPRNYNLHPRGSYPNLKAVDFPTIPRSEWSQRIKDKSEGKQWISDICLERNVPCLDQAQRGYCQTDDNEVLTEEKGWVFWPEYNWTDRIATVNTVTGMMEFQSPLEKHVYEYDGPIHYSKNKRVDFAVTPDHQMLVRKWDEAKRTLSSDYSFVRAADLGWYCGLMAAPKNGQLGTELVELGIEGDRNYDGDDFLAMLSLVVSDGYAGGTENTRNQVSFCCFDPERMGPVGALAERLGFKKCPSKDGVWIRYGAGALAEWIRRNVYEGCVFRSPNKKIPSIVKVASQRQIKLFLQWFGDRNHKSKQEVYYSASKRLIGDIQDLLLRIGKRGTIKERGPRIATLGNGKKIESKISYVLNVSSTDRLCIDKKKHIEIENYKGLVYCAGVPNHTLITRRNGTVLISSNCWAHSTTFAVQAARAIMGEPVIGLSAYSVACKIKNFQDEGGWGAQSADFIAEHGVCDETVWPQRGTSRSLDTPAAWENAKRYRITTQLADMQAAQYDRNLTFEQFATCWLLGCPTVNDYNWWGHSVGGSDLVEGASMRHLCRNDLSGKLMSLEEFDLCWGMDDPVAAGFGCKIRNSWGSDWGENGFGVLAGDKAIPDGGVGVLVVTAS